MKRIPSLFLCLCLATLVAVLMLQCGYLDSAFSPVTTTPTTLSGRVVDSISRKGISGVKVILSGVSAAHVMSGENGLFQFPQTNTGEKKLIIDAVALGYRPCTLSVDLTRNPNSEDSVFIVRQNNKPRINKMIYPGAGASNVPRMMRFRWSFSDPDFAVTTSEERLSYRFYFGKTRPPAFLDSGALNLDGMRIDSVSLQYTSVPSYIAERPDTFFTALNPDTRYYWRLVVIDLFGDSAVKGTDSFLTRRAFNPDTCPDSMALVERHDTAFCMDRYEFTNGQFADASGGSFIIPDSLVPRPFSPALNTPIILVLYDSASSVCQRLGKRLCNISEWKIATGGYEEWNYPYGYNYDSARCNTELDLNLEQEQQRTVVSVDLPVTCVSPYGIYDLSGNVSEWVESTDADSTAYPRFNNSGIEVSYFAGGSWWSKSASDVNSVYSTSKDRARTDVGFRCCRNIRN